MQVWRRDGTDVWVLVHIEVQGQPERDFGQRMFVYYYRIFDRYERPIMSAAVLADEQADWRPTRFDQELWGCTVEMRYPVVKLLDWQSRQEELEDSANPFATVVLAHLAAQRTREDMQDRGRAKLALTRRLYERGYERQDVLELYRFIDWLLQLPAALETQVWQDIVQLEEATQMTYLSTAERRGREEGLQEGRQEGLQEGLLEGLAVALDLKFGPAGVALIPELRQIGDPAIVQAVGERIKTAQSINDLRQVYAAPDTH